MSFIAAGPDVAVQVLPDGKLDLVRDRSGPNKGNPRFSRDRAHSLFSRIFRRKGRYYWDTSGQSGTLLYTVKDDRTGTPSRLQSHVEDGADQVQKARLIATYQVERPQKGAAGYLLTLSWTIPGQTAPQKKLTVRV